MPDQIPDFLSSYAAASDCSICTIRIDAVSYRGDVYYKYNVFATNPAESSCDTRPMPMVFDAAGNNIDTDSELYSRIVSRRKDAKLLYQCPG